MTQSWREGPVAITGASGQVGTALRARLDKFPNKVLIAQSADLNSAIRDAEVVVHLAGTLAPRRPNNQRAANLDTVSATIDALTGSAVQRTVFLSFITADAASHNQYLRYKAQAESAWSRCGVPAVIFRCGHIYGPRDEPGPTAKAFLAKRGKATILGPGTQRMAPVFRGDVVEAIVHAALDPLAPWGTFELAGPEMMTADAFARALNTPPVRIRHVPTAVVRLASRIVPSLAPLVDVMLADTIGRDDPTVTADAFGITLHTVAESW